MLVSRWQTNGLSLGPPRSVTAIAHAARQPGAATGGDMSRPHGEDQAIDHRPKEDVMQSVPQLDCVGRPRSPAALTSFHIGRPPRNKGLRYPPDPPTVEEIIAVMSVAGDGPDGLRLRALIAVLWRAGLRISEAL